jgi:hypothetical protein
MARVSITDRLLTIELQGLHRLWALKRRIQVPLAHVRGATADPDIIGEPKGIRAPGLHLPGAVIGTFLQDGEKHFWDVRSGRHAIVVELAEETYTRLIVDVDDPRVTVDTINHALSPSRTSL